MSDRAPGELGLASTLNTPLLSPILRLNVDCFEEIFDFLSLSDLCAVGQTCKRMQSVARYYFQQIYSHELAHVFPYRIRMFGAEIHGFRQYIRHISISAPVDLKFLRHIQLQPFNSLIHIFFMGFDFTDENISCIKNFFRKIEVLEIYACKVYVDFHEKILNYCENLKELIVRECWRITPGDDTNWLLQIYTKLEYLDLSIDMPYKFEISELKTFLNNNPSLKTLAINGDFLVMNRNSFLEADFKLTTLQIDVRNADVDYDTIWEIVNQLRRKQKFKKLHFAVNYFDIELEKKVDLLSIIEELNAKSFSESFDWQHLIKLKDLYIADYKSHDRDMEIVAKNMRIINVEKIHFYNVFNKQILSFIRHLPSLTEIRIEGDISDKFGKYKNSINVHELNNERKKLAGARKVVIYVGPEVYLACRWTGVGTDKDLVQIRRNMPNLTLRDYNFKAH